MLQQQYDDAFKFIIQTDCSAQVNKISQHNRKYFDFHLHVCGIVPSSKHCKSMAAGGKMLSPPAEAAAVGKTERVVDCRTRAPSTIVSQLLFLCSARCSSGVESFSSLTTISVEKRRKAQLVRMKGRVRWGRPRTLRIRMGKAKQTKEEKIVFFCAIKSLPE